MSRTSYLCILHDHLTFAFFWNEIKLKKNLENSSNLAFKIPYDLHQFYFILYLSGGFLFFPEEKTSI